MRKLFSLGIFKELLRQTAPYGIFVTLLYGIMSFSMIMGTDKNTYSLIAYDIEASPLAPMLFASVITAVAFSFITSTTASGFYGAISENKLCKLISTYLAALFQCVVPVLLVTGVSSLTFGVLFGFERLYLSEHIILLLNIFSGCFLASALTLMGVLLMGRFASGLIFALQCLYLPLAIVLLVGRLSVSGLDGATIDLTAFQTLPVWAVMNYKEMSVSLESVPVTLITGCVALLIAYFTFKKRGFEISRARTKSGIQVIFNAFCAMPFALLAADIFKDKYEAFNFEGAPNSKYIPLVYAYLILALFTAVMCDMVCSKTFKRILRGVLGAMISVCLVIAIMGVGILIDDVTDDMPIEVRSFRVTYSMSGDSIDKIPDKYARNVYQPKHVVELKKLSFKDKTGILEKAVNKKGYASSSYMLLGVDVIGKGGIKFDATIQLSHTEYADILEGIMSDGEVMEKTLKIERPSSKIILFANALKDGDTLTQREQMDIYKSFYKEYNKLTLEQKALVAGYSTRSLVQSSDLETYNRKHKDEQVASATTILYVFRPCGPDSYLSKYSVYKQLMPNTYEMISERAK